MRYIGELVKISPKWEDVKLIWVTNERDDNDRKTHPSFGLSIMVGYTTVLFNIK